MTDDLILESVLKRDIDLLIIEELLSSPAFRSRILTAVSEARGTPRIPAEIRTKVRHGVYREDGSGESDIELKVEWRGAGGTINGLVLIENKIDAVFQDQQGSRYREFARQPAAAGGCDWSATVLLAPVRYLGGAGDQKQFDALIFCESLAEHVAARAATCLDPETVQRLRYREDVIRQAIRKERRGYAPIIDSRVSSFWHDYWTLASRIAPELRIDDPGAKPGGAGFVRFSQALERSSLVELTRRHKLQPGRVDIEIAGWALHSDMASPAMLPLLSTDMRIRTASKSLAVSLGVAGIDSRQPLVDQSEAADAGIQAAQRLQRWWTENRTGIEAIARRLPA